MSNPLTSLLAQAPPLSPIVNQEIKFLVLTHKSTQAILGKTENYEKLAHMGDALLGAVVAALLHDIFPDLKKGPATDLRKRLVEGDALTIISRHYRIPNSPIGGVPRYLKIQDTDRNAAEMFEGYIGGLYYSTIDSTPRTTHGEGYEVVKNWLWALYTPFAHHFFSSEDVNEIEEDNAAEGAKAEIHQLWSMVASKRGWGELDFGYKAEYPVYGRGEEGKKWVCTLITSDRDGRTWRSEARRTDKKAAANNAAWELLKQVKPLLATGRRI